MDAVICVLEQIEKESMSQQKVYGLFLTNKPIDYVIVIGLSISFVIIKKHRGW